MSSSAAFVPFEGEELESSQYIFENLPPVESVYADVLLSGGINSQHDLEENIFNSPVKNVSKNTINTTTVNTQNLKISKCVFMDLAPYKNVKIEKVYFLSCPWKGWSGLAKIVPKSKPYTVTHLTFKKKVEQKKIPIEDSLNFSPYQPRQVAYFY
uniref:PPP1R35_C domain-containing protein n=1 Tax=Strongyloides papillosus TaxID=174720 RepID=A0A0N5CF68_STREA